MDDKNSELIEKQLSLLIPNIQDLLLEIPAKGLDEIKTKIENEVKKSFSEINLNYDLSKNLPERSDEKYIRIEKYEDYEFTHCIAYEMATRNSEVIKLTSIVDNINILDYYLYNSLPISEKWKMTINILALKKGIIDASKISNNSKAINTTLENFKNFKSELDYLIENNLTQTNIDSITESFHNIIDKNGDDYLLSIINKYNSINFQTNLIPIQGQNLSTIFNNASSKGKINLIQILLNRVELKLEKEYYVVNEQHSITPENIEEYIPKDTNYEPNENISNHIDNVLTDPNYKENLIQSKNLGYISYQGGYEKDNSFYINEVTPNFSQPLRMFNTMKISINPSLPLNDILSFVKKIKEDYDKNETFKSFFELIEEDFSNSMDTTIKSKIKYDKSKWADLFYIYDYFKSNKKKTIYAIADELSLQLTFYYNNLHNKNNPNNLKPIPEKLTNEKLDFEKISYTKEQDFNNELYLSADQIRKFHYKKISSLIEGENPEYKKLVGGKNHDKNSLIDGKNNDSSRL
jgi:hypothetical protein